MAKQWQGSSPEPWVKAVQGLPPEPMKFALNASLSTLATNSNLHSWRKKAHNTCSLCRESRQPLVHTHVLNKCPVASSAGTAEDVRCSLQVTGDFIFHLLLQSPLIFHQCLTVSLIISHQQTCNQTLSGGVMSKKSCGYSN